MIRGRSDKGPRQDRESRRGWLARRLFPALATLLLVTVAAVSTAHAAIIDISLTKTASPTTYSAVGDVITYTYVIQNTGSVTLSSLTLDDDKVPQANFNCVLPFLLGSGASFTCTGTYTITADDIAAGSVTNTATATGLVANTRLKGKNPPAVDIAEAGGPRRSILGSILEHLNPISTAHAQAASVTASAVTTVTYVPPEPAADKKVELFDPRPQTSAVIERFLNHRLYGLLGDEPDRPRFIRRSPNSLWGSPGGSASPFNVSQLENGNRIALSTSLSQMREAASANTLDGNAMTLGSAALDERPGPSPFGGFDLWTEAHFNSYDDTGGADGDFNILYVGADYAVNGNWLVGILGQFDWADESTKADGSKIDGDGWMVGPYVSGRLGDHLFFDWRAAWGNSDNGVTPFGTYTDSFDSDRWLTTARLTGNWVSGPWRLTPSVAVKYGEEQQDAYTDSLGFRIQGQEVSLGQIDFGPEIAYRWLLGGGTVVEPQLGLYGVWNYDDSSLRLNNTTYTPDDFTGRLEGALQVYLPKGWSGRGAVAYDGIGADYDAVTGKVWLSMPLN